MHAATRGVRRIKKHPRPCDDAVSGGRNVYLDGGICLDILQNQWSPIYDIAAILTSIQSLLNDPNPNSPANAEAARLWSENRREYAKRVKDIVELVRARAPETSRCLSAPWLCHAAVRRWL